MTAKIRLQQLECFRALARTGSFEKAGKLLGIAAPTVHQHIMNLQNSVEVFPFLEEKLYDVVDGQHLRITSYGNELLALADAVLNPIEQFYKQSLKRKEGITISVASFESVTTYALPEVVKNLQRNYPDISVRMISRKQAEILSLVSRGDVDIGIAQEGDLQEDILFKVWRCVETVMIVPLNHRISTMPNESLEILDGERLILPPALSPSSSTIRAKLREAGIYRVVVEPSSYECAKKCVAMGLGISLLSDIGITDEDKKTFRVIPVSNLFGQKVYGVVLRRKQSLSSSLKLFLDAMGIECDHWNKQ